MFAIRTTTNKLEINEIWKFSLTALLIEKRTTFVQKHSWTTLITWCKLFCLWFGATGKLCQCASDSLGTLFFFFLKEGGSRRNNLHKIKIKMTELIFRFYCIFFTLSCLVKQHLQHLLNSLLRKKTPTDNRRDRINTVQL